MFRFTIPDWLENFRHNDALVNSVLFHAETEELNQIKAYEALIAALLDRTYFCIAELDRYAARYGKLEPTIPTDPITNGNSQINP